MRFRKNPDLWICDAPIGGPALFLLPDEPLEGSAKTEALLEVLAFLVL
jgi:hypothetical protein